MTTDLVDALSNLKEKEALEITRKRLNSAENPVEIAISIIAEIVKVYRGGRAMSLADALRADRRLPLHPRRVELS